MKDEDSFTSDDDNDDLIAIQEAIDDFEAGDQGISLDEAFNKMDERIRGRLS